MNWKRGTFKRACIDGQHDTPGHIGDDGLWGVWSPLNMCWEVTHIPTGLRVPRAVFTTLKAAKRFCEHIAPQADWKKVGNHISDRRARQLGKIVDDARGIGS